MRFANWLRRMMYGRYGSDKLNMVLVFSALGTQIVSWFLPFPYARLGLLLACYFLLGWAIFRMFSRNVRKRYRENQKFLAFFTRLKDRNHKYYKCPKCRQPVRVPKGKGKIAITCPRCKEKFIRKT